MPITAKVSPFLWFNTQAEEAAKFYISIFKNSRITNTTHYGPGAPILAGTVMTVAFELDGHHFTALNGGPMFKFTEAVSFVIACKDQSEIDHFWDALISHGGQSQCGGWLKDRFGLSWQIVPASLPELIKGPSAPKVMHALIQMTKIDLAKLNAAAAVH